MEAPRFKSGFIFFCGCDRGVYGLVEYRATFTSVEIQGSGKEKHVARSGECEGPSRY